jgi:hypothetical protein
LLAPALPPGRDLLRVYRRLESRAEIRDRAEFGGNQMGGGGFRYPQPIRSIRRES